MNTEYDTNSTQLSGAHISRSETLVDALAKGKGNGSAFLRQAVVLVPSGGVWKFSIPWFYQFVLYSQEWGPGWAGLRREGVAAEGIAVPLGSVPQSHPVAGVGVKSKKLPGTPSPSVCSSDFPWGVTER